VSVVMRAAVKDLIDHPERYPELLAARTPYVLEDTRNPAQAAAWEGYKRQIEGFDMGRMLAAQCVDGRRV
jgi:hypothetical protein